MAGQSDPLFVPSVMKTHIPSTDDPAQEEDLLQRYQERIEKLSQQDRVIKFCTDAGFLTTVDVGQYFMTKDTEEISQAEPQAPRRRTRRSCAAIVVPEERATNSCVSILLQTNKIFCFLTSKSLSR